jgi:hypothetical protein
MTITTTLSRISYNGNGVTTIFSFPYKFLTNADLVVVEVSSAGVETVKTMGSHYSVSGAGNDGGGTVTMTTAPASGVMLLLYRSTAITQETDYISGDPFPAETHERALDKITAIAQEIGSDSARAIKVPVGDSSALATVLPVALSRLDRLLAFDATTGAIEMSSFTQTQVASAIAAAYAAGSTADAVTFLQAGTGAVARTAQEKMREFVSVLDFDADPTGVADSSAAFQAAYDTGKAVWIPAGTYLLNTGINCTTTSTDVLTPGPRFIGEGIGLVTINSPYDGPVFDVTTDTTLKFQIGGEFSGFKLVRTGSPTAQIGIRLRRCWLFSFEDIWIFGPTLDGIQIVMSEGDADGSLMLTFRRMRIENCGRWGFHTFITGAYNEISFTKMEHIFFHANGTSSADAIPPSGGMKWKGQVLDMSSCGFTESQNCALYIFEGTGGLGNTVNLEAVVFENSWKRHFYCDGISSLRGRALQMYTGNVITAHTMMEFDGASSTIRNIDIEGVVVRLGSANNPATAFKISGANAETRSCRVRNVDWGIFDHAGQTRFDGWEFDPVEQDCHLVTPSGVELFLRPKGTGNKTPFRLSGPNTESGGVPSTSGEWIALSLNSVGVFIANTGLANSTRYYVYLYDDQFVAKLELSTTGPAIDATHGYKVKTGDASRLYVGSVITNGSGAFLRAGTGWLNAMEVPGTEVGVPAYLWSDATGDLRIKATAPTSDTDGTIVGTQS